MTPGSVDLLVVGDRLQIVVTCLTHHYEKVTELDLFGIVSRHLGDIEAIAESLRAAAADLANRF